MVKNILNDHIVGGKPFKKAASKEDYYTTLEKQTRVALAHGGSIDPENINEYIQVGGYESLKKVLSKILNLTIYEQRLLMKASWLS